MTGESTANLGSDSERMVVDPIGTGFFLTILLKVSPGRARAVAMFNAAATVTRVQSVEGFVAATFMESGDDLVFELVEWQSASALEMARGDNRYSDHIDILREHSTPCFLGLSPTLAGNGEIAFGRGDIVYVTLTEAPGASPAGLMSSLNTSAAVGMVHHLIERENGSAAISLSKASAATLPIGARRWMHQFRVVEAITSPANAVGRPVHYRLLKTAQEGASAHA